MEKVFHINLGAMVFTIEEEAYYQLKQYIDRLQQHFISNADIVADIEFRMGELFNARLGNGKISITLDDVKQVVEIMGNVDQLTEGDNQRAINDTPEKNDSVPLPKLRKLRRNPLDESIGGVASGIGSFFDIDPAIVRVLFVLSVILYGGGILFYLVLWIVLPVATGEDLELMRLQKQGKTKKLFRDTDSRAIAGVCSGLAQYLGIDVVYVRLALVASVFLFGSGIGIYLILWIIIPKAITAADKLMMRGEQVDIRNIERQVMTNPSQGKMSNMANKGASVAGKLLRVLFKTVVAFVALILFVCLLSVFITMLALFFGFGNANEANEIIQYVIADASIVWAAKIGLLLLIALPILSFFLLALQLLVGRRFLKRPWIYSLSGLFILGIILTAYSGISMFEMVKTKQNLSHTFKVGLTDSLYIKGIEAPVLVLMDDTNEDSIDYAPRGWNLSYEIEDATKSENMFPGVAINHKKGIFYFDIDDFQVRTVKNADSISLKVILRSRGRDFKNALANIKMIEFPVTIKGNEITIPTYFQLLRDQNFRFQEVDVVLTVPEGTHLHFDQPAKEILDDNNLDEADGEWFEMIDGEMHCTD